jgi:MFS family permease
MVIRSAIVREYFGRDSFGKMLGIIMGSASVGGIIGPTLAGWSYDTWGSYRPIWHVFLVLLFLGIILIVKLKPLEIKGS